MNLKKILTIAGVIISLILTFIGGRSTAPDVEDLVNVSVPKQNPCPETDLALFEQEKAKIEAGHQARVKQLLEQIDAVTQEKARIQRKLDELKRRKMQEVADAVEDPDVEDLLNEMSERNEQLSREVADCEKSKKALSDKVAMLGHRLSIDQRQLEKAREEASRLRALADAALEQEGLDVEDPVVEEVDPVYTSGWPKRKNSISAGWFNTGENHYRLGYGRALNATFEVEASIISRHDGKLGVGGGVRLRFK